MQRVLDRNKAGGIMGHLTQEVVGDIPIPVPSPETQGLIASRIRDLRADAQKLRADAEAGWEEAKRWFEEQLLGPAQPAPGTADGAQP